MAATKMKKTKIECRKSDCSSLPYGKRKQTSTYGNIPKTNKQIKLNLNPHLHKKKRRQNKSKSKQKDPIKEKRRISRANPTTEVLIKNEKNSKGRTWDTKKN